MLYVRAKTWSESSFGSEGDAPDGDGGDWMEGMGDGGEEEGGGGVVGTLKKLYTLFGGGDD